MPDFESNYSNLKCPFCNKSVANSDLCLGNYCFGIKIIDLEEEEIDFFNCPECGGIFKVELAIHKDYEYIVSKPTKKEAEEYDLPLEDQEIIEDIPGQKFFWSHLLIDEG